MRAKQVVVIAGPTGIGKTAVSICAAQQVSGEIVNAEPGVDEEGLEALAAAGRTVRRWPERHHYFGGVSLLGRTGAAADPRRSGVWLPLS